MSVWVIQTVAVCSVLPFSAFSSDNDNRAPPLLSSICNQAAGIEESDGARIVMSCFEVKLLTSNVRSSYDTEYFDDLDCTFSA
jgi:hypothetical protein